MSLTLTDATPVERHYRPMRRASGLRVLRCHCHAGVDERPVDEQHEAFSITLLERGTLGYRTTAGSAVLSPGWLMLGNPGEAYVCSHEHGDGTGDDCAVLSMSAQTLDEVCSALGRTGVPPTFNRAGMPPLPRVAALFGGLLDDGDEGFALEETALAVVDAVHAALCDGQAPEPAMPQDDRALAAVNCIEQRATEPLSLDDVARCAGVGSFHLVRMFRRSIGVTPHQYLMRVRLLRAISLLRDTARPVTDVAYDSGWSDLSNFSRTFRREVGCSPNGFRKGGVAGS
ncbi:helix-turn-helix transcriptional regulator [Piscinibacter terrae]|uniref:AraC family transcriptional regulator n=1 Tax=Piscinibacter terrae TaxID=2496871 RepID=A0A3N7HUI3_9BURK|nr:AraC family transcriptional regulator [Albitalea terrae]RQP25924.1 AraC family transcriptional regulator [Albitalea terrae]